MTPSSLAATHLAAFGPLGAWDTKTFEGLFKDPVVLICGSADSFVVGRVVADEAEILTLATHPANQRKGSARRVLKHFLEMAHGAGAAHAFLEVADDNNAARALYAGEAFETVGQRKNYYRRENGPPATALILRKELP